MLTEKDYCDYKLVLELKELGYDYIRREGLIHLYDAQKWLREEFKILIVPRYRELMEMWDCIIYDENKINIYTTSTFKQYEESLLEGTKEAVKILKEE